MYLVQSDIQLFRLFGPRKKLTNAIARWHSQAPTAISNQLEQAYADRLEGQLQEMAVQLHKVYYILIESSFVVIVMATTRDIEPLRI